MNSKEMQMRGNKYLHEMKNYCLTVPGTILHRLEKPVILKQNFSLIWFTCKQKILPTQFFSSNERTEYKKFRIFITYSAIPQKSGFMVITCAGCIFDKFFVKLRWLWQMCTGLKSQTKVKQQRHCLGEIEDMRTIYRKVSVQMCTN
jgi:hypothetical protein